MDNLDVETIEKIQDPWWLFMDSEDETVSIPDTEPDGTADCVHQGNLNDEKNISDVEPTNLETSTSNEHYTNETIQGYSRG